MSDYSSYLTKPAIISGIILILIIVLYKWTFKSKRKNIWIGFAVLFTFYSFIVGSAALTDMKYKKELDSYDLNKDGFFLGNEITPEQEAAMFQLTNDVGRNFTVFTGAIIGGILGFIAFLIACGFDKYNRLKIEEKTKHNKKYT